MDAKRLFSRFIGAAGDRIHLAAHSHHYWPDATLAAHERAWLDAALHVDDKWSVVFGEVLPRAQAHVASTLRLPDPSSVAFGPNTHDFLVRILSSLDPSRPPRILTTDGEFHSASRQFARLEEDGLAVVTRVASRPFDTFASRFAEAARSGSFDLAYVSHVFFDSGRANLDLDGLVAAISDPRTVVVVDGYHGFRALPTDLSRIASRVFYMAGGYKYAMSGENACFVHAPAGWIERPRVTGWFASFGALAQKQGGIPYASGGARLMGATFDPTGLYRFVAAMDMLEREGLTVERVLAHVHALQRTFVETLRAQDNHPLVDEALLVPVSDPARGHFLTYRLDDAASLHRKLHDAGIVTDVRGDRLRFGFAVYHDEADARVAAERVARALR